VALVQGYLTLKEGIPVHEEIERALLDGSFGQVAVGTQVRCMNGLEGSMPGKCGPVPELTPVDLAKFLSVEGTLNPEDRLPKLTAEELWTEIHSSVERHREFVSQPRCVKGTEFESLAIEFKEGINRFLQAEWREIRDQEVQKRLFTRASDAGGVLSEFRSGNGISLRVPACGLASNR
jgi:hypothetical protein